MSIYIRFFNTVKYLKLIQIYFRIFYLLRAKYRNIIGFKYKFQKNSSSVHLELLNPIVNKHSNCMGNQFSFLNLSKKFENGIDWNYNKYGKLWTYNLTYFEYLKDKKDVSIIYDFIKNISEVKDGLESFPISLRGINWIKFLSEYDIKDKKIDDSLYAQYYILLDNLEYHLLGNHLLENGFSLLFASYYFQDEVLYQKAKEILTKELKEQILDDGAHFELSPMYHQIMLYRVLDCLNLITSNSLLMINKEEQRVFQLFLEKKAKYMLSWLNFISYEDGTIPLLNDSTHKIAPTTRELNEYAHKLQIDNHQVQNINLQSKNSGYRKVKKERYECLVDVGEVGASYIPGHAHADTFNFELYIDKKPFIVDSGVSTYTIGQLRDYERSTKAHNTVEINSQNSSEIWGGFRVANRASIVEIVENCDHIKATHNGYYKKFAVFHTRVWKFEDDKLIISDILDKQCDAIARLHFHPDIVESDIKKRIQCKNKNIEFSKYGYSFEFNKTIEAIVLEVKFTNNLEIEIKI